MVVAPGNVLLALYALSAALAAVVLWGSWRAYALTRAPHLQNLFLGFALLVASYTAVLLNRLILPLGWGYHTTLWVHELAQLGAFVLLAASYHARERGMAASKARGLQVGIAVALVLSVAVFLAMPRPVAWNGRDATALGIYLLAALPLGYVMVRAAQGLRARGRGAVLVPAGFATWVLGQGLWMLWAASHDWSVVVLANVAFAGGLAMFAVAVLPAWRRDGLPRAA